MKRDLNHEISATSVRKSIRSICNTEEETYPIEEIKRKVTEYYYSNINELSENALINRCLQIESRTKYAPNVLISLAWGLVTSFVWKIIDGDKGIFTLLGTFGKSIEELGHRGGIDSLISIMILSIVFFLVFAMLMGVVTALVFVVYRNCKKIWCDKYNVFISDYEKQLIMDILRVKAKSASGGRSKVIPRKRYIIKK